jgi:hypothetical protein
MSSAEARLSLKGKKVPIADIAELLGERSLIA